MTIADFIAPELPVWFSRDLIEALPIGIYLCDTRSVIVAYNSKAAEIWGHEPAVGDTQNRFSGAYRFNLPNGRNLSHDQTPMATVERTRVASDVFEAILERRDGSRRNVLASAAPLFDEGRAYIGFVTCVQDITVHKAAVEGEAAVRDALAIAKRTLRANDRTLSELSQVNAELVESEQFLQGILDSVSDCIEVLDAEGRIQFMNRDGLRAMEIDDFSAVRGGDWANDYCGDQVEAARAAIAMAKSGGVGRFETRAPTLKGNMLWWDIAVTPIADGVSSKGLLLAISRDISERKTSEDARKLMAQELQHRLKNTIAMVQAIANQSLRNATSLAQAKEVLGKRIAILGKAHDILLHEEAGSADLVNIVGAMVDLHADRKERFVVDGVNLQFGPKPAMAVALALHELATNAQKYGALSSDDGSIEIRWELVGDDRLSFTWTEVGGPPVEVPTTKGFGSRLTQVMLADTIGSNPQVSYEPTGVRFEFVGDLSRIQAE